MAKFPYDDEYMTYDYRLHTFAPFAVGASVAFAIGAPSVPVTFIVTAQVVSPLGASTFAITSVVPVGLPSAS